MGQQVMLTRQALEKCVKNYKYEKASYFMTADQLKPKQIENAIARFAPKVKAKDVVALMDTTLFSSGKDGYLITLTHMYGKSMGNKTIDLNKVNRVTRKDSYLTVYYPDGSSEKHYVSIFDQDLFNFLKMVMEESARLNEEAQQSEEIKDDLVGQIVVKLNEALHGGDSGLVEAPEPPEIIDEPEDVPEKEPSITPTPAFDPIDEPDDEEPQENADADALFAQGQKLFMAKDYAAAVDAFQKAADLGHQKAAQFLAQLKAIVGSDN